MSLVRGMALAAAAARREVAKSSFDRNRSRSLQEKAWLDRFLGRIRLDQFDAAVSLGKEGRTALKGATLELKTVATLIARTVRVMDARNRQRFQDDPQALGSWLSAKRVLGNPNGSGAAAPADTGSSGTPAAPVVPGSETPAGGDVRPAA